MTIKYEDLLALAPTYETEADMPSVPQLGDTARVGDTLYMRVTGHNRWRTITPENFNEVMKVLETIKSMVKNFSENVREQVIVSPIHATLEELQASEPAENNPFARLEHEGGDVYVHGEGGWTLAAKGKSLEDIKELDTAEADLHLRARDLSTQEGMALAPTPDQWALVTEQADTNYPDMHDAEGVRLPTDEVSRRHVEYLDLQTRVMLTKSTMQAFGGNARPGHQFTEAWLTETCKKGGINIFERKATGKGENLRRGAFTTRVGLPGINVTLEDTNRRTLMVRAIHFIATRHDPDTAVYINARLQEFMRKPEWNRDPAAEQPVQ